MLSRLMHSVDQAGERTSRSVGYSVSALDQLGDHLSAYPPAIPTCHTSNRSWPGSNAGPCHGRGSYRQLSAWHGTCGGARYGNRSASSRCAPDAVAKQAGASAPVPFYRALNAPGQYCARVWSIPETAFATADSLELLLIACSYFCA